MDWRRRKESGRKLRRRRKAQYYLYTNKEMKAIEEYEQKEDEQKDKKEKEVQVDGDIIFKTASGREMKDGGGITPDIESA